MQESIRVLHVEDNPDHALLIRRSLEREDPGLRIVTASSAEEALRVIGEGGCDVILSDYLLGPEMSGLDLLERVRAREIGIPFIILTGQGNEEVASQALRMGADDYIIKRSGLLQFKRLALTIRRQWEAYRDRLAREETEARYRHLVENVNAGIALLRGERATYVNPKLCEMLGYSAVEFTSRPFIEFVAPRSREMVMERYRRRQAGEELDPTYDLWAIHRDGQEVCLELTASARQDPEGMYTLAVVRDVTEERRSKARARQAEERWRLVLEQASDAVFLHDTEGKILDANPAASRLTGYSREELLSMHVQDLHIPEERALSESELIKTRKGEFFGFTATALSKDGSQKGVAVTATFLEGGDERLLLSLVKELPGLTPGDWEERVSHEAEARFKAALDQAPLVAVQGYDQEGRVTYWNRASEELYGFRQEEALGKTLDQLILDHEEAASFLEELRLIGETGRPSAPREWITRDRWGNQRWVYSTIFPVMRAGRPIEVFCMDIDITARKELEDDLRERNEDLAAFAQMVSHDLRAPLTSIDGFARLARDAAEGRCAPHEMEYFDYILRACRGMERIIDSVMEMARCGLEPWNRVEVNLADMAREIWDDLRMQEQAPQARMLLSLQRESVTADPVLLRQVLVNLVENALKFNRETSGPLVEVSSDAGDGETVIAVRDNGPGIPEEMRESLFEPFRQMDEGSPGYGMGLYVVRRIVASWRGRVWLDSTPGEGASFYFTVPD
ncbi:MAG: PAS domain S-box protein [Actinobacteria bacterium]|nr:PAS domain S-box protein [Actinomycetota bacterium]